MKMAKKNAIYREKSSVDDGKPRIVSLCINIRVFLSFSVRSGFTFLSGIFMYAITWIVLRTDGGDESISSSQWKDFMVGSFCLGFLFVRFIFLSPSLTNPIALSIAYFIKRVTDLSAFY